MKLVIIPRGIPKALVGVKLPVQVVLPSGDVTYKIVRLQEGQPSELEIAEPGPYRLRAELPEGRRLSVTSEGQKPLELRLSPTPDENTRPAWRRRSVQSLFRSEDLERIPYNDFAYLVASVTSLKAIRLDGGVVRVVVEKPKFPARTFEDTIRLPTAESSSDPRLSKPTLLIVEGYGYGFNVPSLIVAPPSAGALNILRPEVSHADINAASPSISFASSDPTADAVYSFLHEGSASVARHMADDIRERAVEMLRRKFSDPAGACVAGYALLRLAKIDYLDWWGNLAHSFEMIPDGAILYAWALIRTGHVEEALEWFLTAAGRGIPIYTEGVRLLQDGLALAAQHSPDTRRLVEARKLVHALSLIVNHKSPITWLPLNSSLVSITT